MKKTTMTAEDPEDMTTSREGIGRPIRGCPSTTTPASQTRVS
nr:TPA_asm: M32 iORF [Murid betaherpesvirus 1]DBA07955.1 TPA_asm: M32 iORF [Murid betaherpesvirus 1]